MAQPQTPHSRPLSRGAAGRCAHAFRCSAGAREKDATMNPNPSEAAQIAVQVMELFLKELDPRPRPEVMAFALAYAIGNIMGAFSDLSAERFDEATTNLSKAILDHARRTRDAVQEQMQ
jgi:hypothetical protein